MFGQSAKTNLARTNRDAALDESLASAPASPIFTQDSLLLLDPLPAKHYSASSSYSPLPPDPLPPNNIAPENLRFSLSRREYSQADILAVTLGWLYDSNGGEDIASISFELIENGNSLGNVGTVTNFNIATWDNKWSNFDFQLNLASLSLTGGTYQIIGQARDSVGATSNLFQRSFLIESTQGNNNNAPQNLVFSLSQNAYEATDTIQIQSGWINDLDGASDLANIVFSLWQNGSELDTQSLNVLNPAPWNDKWASFSYNYTIANLGLSSGNYTLRGIAYDQVQANSNTFERSLQIIDSTPVNEQPTSLQFSLDSNSYTLADSLTIERGWVMDEDGAQDLDKISLSLWQNRSKLADIGEITNLIPATWNDKWASFRETYAIADWNLGLGNYTLQATAYDIGGLASDQFERSFAIAPASTIDLRGQSFDITSNSADTGASVTANFQLQNLGNSASGTFRVGFYLSTDTTITVSDRLLGFVDLNSLNADESSNILSQNLNIPDSDDPFWQGSGNYYIGIILDDLGAIAESNENNNASQGIGTDLDSIEINLPGAIDLKANSLTIDDYTGLAGSNLTADITIQNIGDSDAGSFRIGFYFSSDETITTSDRLLDFMIIDALGAGVLTQTLSKVLTLPESDDSLWKGSTDNHYIGVIIDDLNVILEEDENNNSNQRWLIDIYPLKGFDSPTIDVRTESFSLSANSLSAGDSFDYTWQVKNSGTQTLNDVSIGFYISEDSTIDTDDYRFSGANFPTLGAGGIGGTTWSTQLPDKFWSNVWTKGNGTYYIGMIVDRDNAIAEDLENNNSNRGMGIDIAEIQVNNTGVFNTTGNNDIDSLLNETRTYWEGGQGSTNPNTVTYSFYQNTSGAYYGSEENVAELDESIKTNVREILSNLSQFINLDFQEVADTANSYGVMRFMFSSSPDYAFASYPHPSNEGGDVFFNPNFRNNPLNWFGEGKGSHGYTTIIHEILHALGLKHPGQYGNDDVNPFLTGEQDNLGNTVMTYNFNFQGKAITPMSYDIRALQYLYGARNSNHSHTTYTFTEVDSYSIGNQLFGSTTDKIKQTVWDSEGIDIFDASNLAMNENYRFDLREGGVITTQSSYDSINYDDEGGRGSFSTYDEGTAIAFNTIIENLITSQSSDYIFANNASNVFSGYVKGTIAGDDWFEGFDNSDLLDLNSYNLIDITEEILGNDLKLTLGADGSITLKDYFGSNGSIRKQIDNQYYTYSQTSGWQATTAPEPIIPSPDNTEIPTSGTDAIAISNPLNTPLVNAIDNNSLANPVISLVEIEHPPIDTPIPARCGCAFHLAGGGLSYARSASLADLMGLSPV